MSLLGMFKGAGKSGYGYSTSASEVTEGLDLSGRTYLVTGCNSGLGERTMEVLTRRGATVIGAARTKEKAAAACKHERAVPIACELSEPASVRAAVDEVQAMDVSIDGIIANAGIMALPKLEQKHGLELQFLTNHIGHFILVTGLLDKLSEQGRVVVLSSGAHTRAYAEGIRLDDLAGDKGKYSALGAYGQSKLANLLFASHLATTLPAGQTANSVHPGVIATNLGRHLPGIVQAVFRGLGPALVLKSVGDGRGHAVLCRDPSFTRWCERGLLRGLQCHAFECARSERAAGRGPLASQRGDRRAPLARRRQLATVGHLAAGLIGGSVCKKRWLAVTLWLVFVSFLPDADVVAFKFGIPYEAPFGHRGASHSFTFRYRTRRARVDGSKSE